MWIICNWNAIIFRIILFLCLCTHGHNIMESHLTDVISLPMGGLDM